MFEVESIDRMYLNVYVPGLQYAAGLVAYVHRQLGLPVPSTVPLGKITGRFVAAVHRFAQAQAVPRVDFAHGQRKDDGGTADRAPRLGARLLGGVRLVAVVEPPGDPVDGLSIE